MIQKILLLVLFVSCATKPTPYQHEHHKQGYRDIEAEGLRVSSFKGNSVTKVDQAVMYAQFRAVDHCRSENLHANIVDTLNKTVKKNVTRTSGSSFGPTYWGMYPYYSRYSSIGFGAGWNTMNSNSWNETLTFPQIEVYFNCAKTVFRPKLHFKEISDEQMKLLVKDLKGALQIEKIDEDSPNKSAFETGDIILKADGKRIERVYQLLSMISPDKKSVTLSIMREGLKMEKVLTTTDVTENVVKAEDDVIQKVCKLKNKEEQKDLTKSKSCNG